MVDGSYNSFLQQVGFCKMQTYDTLSRTTSIGPTMFMDGRVKFGVGLSDVQFQGSASSCGKCINISHIDNFFTFNDELTNWNYDSPIETPFTVFVMDQCKDPICTSKFLDFDIYNLYQPVANGNPRSIEWEFIPCPVNEDKIEILACLGPNSCNVHDLEERSYIKMINEAVDSGYWYCHIRNHRLPIVNVSVTFGSTENETYMQLEDNNGWLWNHYDDRKKLKDTWNFFLTTADGVTKQFTWKWKEKMNMTTTYGYRGGIIIQTDIQV